MLISFNIFLNLTSSVMGDADLPEWMVGDRWEYDKSETYSIGSINNTIDLIYRYKIETKVLNLTTLYVNGTYYEVYGIETRTELQEAAGIPQEGFIIQDNDYILRSNLAILRRVNTYSESPYVNSTLIWTYDPPKREYDFPITIGKSWTAHTTQRVYGELIGYDNSTIVVNYTVEEKETVTVKAGTFECYRIRVDDGSGLLTYNFYSPEIKNAVKISREYEGYSMTIELTPTTYNTNNEDGDTFALRYIILFILVIITILLLIIWLVLSEKKKRAEETKALSKLHEPPIATDEPRVFSPPPEMPEAKYRASRSMPPGSPRLPTCPVCGYPLSFIQQYNKWYCTNCEKYL